MIYQQIKILNNSGFMLRNINLIKRLIMSYIKKFQSGGISNPKEEQIGNYIRRSRGVLGGFTWSDTSKGGAKLMKEIQVGNWILKPDGTKVHVTARQANKQAARQTVKTQSVTSIPSSIAFAPWNQEPYMDQEEIGNSAVTSKTEQQSDIATARDRKTNKAAIRSKITPKGQAYWDSQYKDFLSRMTDDQKAWLAQRGIDYNSAEEMQGYLSRIGKNVGKFGVDNKWGKDSQAAWDDLVNTTMKNNPLQTPIKEEQVINTPVVDAPDPFGYKTSNTYESNDFANKLKKMGIRSNADLINFMNTSGKAGWSGDAWQKQFRSDVDKALNGDYSDDNIRKVFNTQGNWGNGFMGRGDYGDFQNVLQTNTGVWNGIYDAKQNEARMNTARQQYAAKLAQQFTPQLLKPNVEDPSKKFMIGKTQTNTLGDQFGLFKE